MDSRPCRSLPPARSPRTTPPRRSDHSGCRRRARPRGPALSDALLTEEAPAKVNLALHVTGRRPDGYHELESLIVFAGVADEIVARHANKDSLKVTGPFAAAAGSGDANL